MAWLETPNIDIYFVVAVLFFFGFVEFLLGHYSHSKRSKDDYILELGGFFVVGLTKSIVVFVAHYIATLIAAPWFGAFANWSLWLSLPFYLLIDDFLQYWYHRSAHEYKWLWKHHYNHHAAEDMGVFVSYRNSWVYYLIMPNIWWTAIATFLGLGAAAALGIMIKLVIISSSHSTWVWDKWFYKTKALSPLMSVIERIVITPAFHHGHHAKSKLDGIGDPNGNFGNAFSIWDQLFETAHFSRQFPKEYGLMETPKDPWYSQLLFPFVKSNKVDSEIHADFEFKKYTQNEPLQTKLAAGKYLYCQCGYSKDQPFCNGSHHGTKQTPLVFEMKKERTVSLCRCKKTKTPPYCDNSHLA